MRWHLVGGRFEEPSTDDQKYGDWEVRIWVLNSMEDIAAACFLLLQDNERIMDSISFVHLHKKNNVWIYQFVKRHCSVKPDKHSLGNYHAKLHGILRELCIYYPMHPCCMKEQTEELEAQHIWVVWIPSIS